MNGIDDSMLLMFSPVCTHCKYIDLESIEHKCLAYPSHIPDKIWFGKNDHKNPYPGDHGIQFEPV